MSQIALLEPASLSGGTLPAPLRRQAAEVRIPGPESGEPAVEAADTSAGTALRKTILVITASSVAAGWAAELPQQVGRRFPVAVETASTRQEAIEALRRRSYALVILDSAIAESDPAGADLIWKRDGLGVPVEVNFALANCARLAREARAALSRREQEQAQALRAAAELMEAEMRSAVTGLLLQAQLALAEPSVTPPVAGRLRKVAELAESLRRKLEKPSERASGH